MASSDRVPARRSLCPLWDGQLLGRWGAGVVTGAQLLTSPSGLIGTVEQIAAALHARRAQYDFSNIVVFAAAREAFAPVVARLAGTCRGETATGRDTNPARVVHSAYSNDMRSRLPSRRAAAARARI
jgi:hypothetical protein